jgi:hypothetical protein
MYVSYEGPQPPERGQQVVLLSLQMDDLPVVFDGTRASYGGSQELADCGCTDSEAFSQPRVDETISPSIGRVANKFGCFGALSLSLSVVEKPRPTPDIGERPRIASAWGIPGPPTPRRTA